MIEVDDGDVFLNACSMPDCRLNAEDGDITISEAKGSFDITVDDGNVTMRQIAAKGLIMRSEDGDIDLDRLADACGVDVDVDYIFRLGREGVNLAGDTIVEA